MANFVTILVVFSIYFLTLLSINIGAPSNNERLFSKFIKDYGKIYENGSAEYEKRFENFQESLTRHRLLNSQRTNTHDAIYGVTKFSDLTPEEFGLTVLGGRAMRPANPPKRSPSKLRFQNILSKLDSIPPKYDLRDKSVLTPVKDQGSCGACWAFATVECLETQHALKTQNLYVLSVQQIVDCSSQSTGDAGCSGGYLCETAKWLLRSQEKLELAKDYPYQKKQGTCKYVESKGLVYETNYTCKGYTNEKEMIQLVYNHGPLLAAVDATSFQDYMGGIIQHHCTDKYDNHAVQIVGYDETGGVPYYIVRNSWGPDWGLEGYLYIKIGDNVCGIANSVGSVDTN